MKPEKRFFALALMFLVFPLSLSCTSAGDPKIQVQEARVDYGRVPVGQMVRHRFHFRNSGNAPLQLTNRFLPGNALLAKTLEGC